MKEGYFEHPAVSRSLLVELNKHPKNVLNQESESSPGDAFRIGNAFDDLMYNYDMWEKIYHVYTNTPPTGKMKILTDEVIYLRKNDPWATEKEIFDKAYIASGYQLDKEKIGDNFSKFESYVEERVENSDKVEISEKEYSLMLKMRNGIMCDPNLAKFFIAEKDHMEVKFQLQSYWKEEVYVDEGSVEVECKCMLDSVLIDHKNKFIYPCDLKTTGFSVYSFPKSYYKFQYYLQAGMYTQGVKEWAKTEGLGDYHVDSFKFIVAEKNAYNPPLMYTVSENDLHRSLTGFVKHGRFHKGFKQLLSEYVWHNKHDLWEHPKDVYDNKRNLILDLDEC